MKPDLLISIHRELGIDASHLAANRLERSEEPALEELTVAEIEFDGTPFVLHRLTAIAWKEMKAAAFAEGLRLNPFSGFRSYLHQKRLIERHLRNGRALGEILTHIAIPGFSEHHTGRAIDLHADDRFEVEEAFELTPQFAWLKENAQRFGFRLSYPRDNASGIIYEPWHWYYLGR